LKFVLIYLKKGFKDTGKNKKFSFLFLGLKNNLASFKYQITTDQI